MMQYPVDGVIEYEIDSQSSSRFYDLSSELTEEADLLLYYVSNLLRASSFSQAFEVLNMYAFDQEQFQQSTPTTKLIEANLLKLQALAVFYFFLDHIESLQDARASPSRQEDSREIERLYANAINRVQNAKRVFQDMAKEKDVAICHLIHCNIECVIAKELIYGSADTAAPRRNCQGNINTAYQLCVASNRLFMGLQHADGTQLTHNLLSIIKSDTFGLLTTSDLVGGQEQTAVDPDGELPSLLSNSNLLQILKQSSMITLVTEMDLSLR